MATRRVYPTYSPGSVSTRQSLIPRRDEPSPFQRDRETVQRAQDEESWPWEETAETPEYPQPAATITSRDVWLGISRTGRLSSPESNVSPPENSVEVTFEESMAERRAITRPPGYWKMRSGKFLAIREMEDSHLLNCILMCERNSQARGRRASGGVYEELRQEQHRRRRQEVERNIALPQFLEAQTRDAQLTYWQMTRDLRLGRAGAAMGNPDGASLGQGSAVAMFGGLQTTEAPPPEPLPSHSVIEDNRPTRRIKK